MLYSLISDLKLLLRCASLVPITGLEAGKHGRSRFGKQASSFKAAASVVFITGSQGR